MSARNVAHRSEQVFEDVVRKSSSVLKRALQSTSPVSSNPAVQDVSSSVAKSNRRGVSTRFQRAYALHRLQRYDQAIDGYNDCALQEPMYAPVFYNRGCALYALGRRDDAVLDFTKAIKMEVKNMLFIESRAIVLKELGRFHEAVHDYACLEALRRMAASASAPALRNAAKAHSGDLNADSGSDPHAHHGSFSSLFADFTSSFQTPPIGSILMNAVNGEKESHARDWFLRFLKQKPVARTPSDVQEAIKHAKTWSFFRGMSKEMIEQCLEEATYGHFETDQVIVEQGIRSHSFHVVLNTVASLVKNIDSHGVSKVRELKTLCQGDTVGTEPFGFSFADGTLRTLQHIVAFPQRSLLSSSPPSRSIPEAREVPSGGGGDGGQLFPVEPASFLCLDEVHCLVLSTEVYRSILHDHEEKDLDARIQFLRACRVFQSCSEDVMTSLAAVSSRKIYDPGKEILQTGDIVTQLCVIKRGVCQVRKTITMFKSILSSTKKKTRSSSLMVSDSLLTSRSNDGSWVLDNGWMLTNPRLVNNARNGKDCEKTISEDVNVAILVSGQMFGELSVLQPGQPSQVTIRTQTMVEILVFQEADLARLNVQFQSGTMNALQDSLLFHNPPQQKIIQLHRELDHWEKEKRCVLDELFSKSSSPLSRKHKSATASPSRRVRDAKANLKLSPLKKASLEKEKRDSAPAIQVAQRSPSLVS